MQPIEAVLPDKFTFWEAENSKDFKILADATNASRPVSTFVKNQIAIWEGLDKTVFYPADPTFKRAAAMDWIDIVNIDPKSFFFAKDLQSLGDVLKMLARIAKIKSVFRVTRPEGGYDLNYSYLAWGPQSKYITHSHAICEFYYLLEGEVEYIINQQKYHAVPGNFYFHPPYYDHEMRGLKPGVPFLSISGSWIPFGKRALFEKPFLLLEDISVPMDSKLSKDFNFHNFKLNRTLQFGLLGTKEK